MKKQSMNQHSQSLNDGLSTLLLTSCLMMYSFQTAVQISVDMNDQAVLVDLLNVLCLKQ